MLNWHIRTCSKINSETEAGTIEIGSIDVDPIKIVPGELDEGEIDFPPTFSIARIGSPLELQLGRLLKEKSTLAP